MRKPTITELNNTIEVMRKAYNFNDDETKISQDNNLKKYACTIELITTDKATDTVACLSKDVIYSEDKPFERK